MEIEEANELEIMNKIRHVLDVQYIKELQGYFPIYIRFENTQYLKNKTPFIRAVIFLENKYKGIKDFPEDWDGKFLALETVDGEYIPYFQAIKLILE